MTLDMARYPHHDGSTKYVERDGESVTAVRLLVPVRGSSSAPWLRLVQSGDAFYVTGELERTDHEGQWWRFGLAEHRMPYSYSFIYSSVEGAQVFVNAAGVHGMEQAGIFDFKPGTVRDLAPLWARRSTAYYIFLDRFSRSDRSGGRDHLSDWRDPVEVDYPANVRQFFGGDLWGVRDRISYLTDLGVSMIMLSPFFPAPESHRYCATDFDSVDEILGGMAALASLTKALRESGMHCVGDFTVNHCGADHPWFQHALGGGVERSLFHVGVDEAGGYATYKDVVTLPKFNYANEMAAHRLWGSSDAPVRSWLREPFRLDGWRLDAAAMVGRHGDIDVNARVAGEIRRAMTIENPNAFHVAEILHDPAPDLSDGRWSGSVMCAGFATPVRQFVAGLCTADAVCSALRQFASELSWQSLVSSVAFVGSHDLPRLRSVAVSDAAAVTAHFMLMTFPGIPMVYGGDEMGVRGDTSDAGRVPLPWDDHSPQNDPYWQSFRALIRLRKDAPWLSDAGLRWLAVTETMFAYERVGPGGSRMFCALASSAGTWTLQAPFWGYTLTSAFRQGLDADAADGRIALTSSTAWTFGVWRVSRNP